ncbi:hypothetical protein M8C21_011964 [Ambrosia artemisiifolia]|uniref:Uncharacterized protein n=1 Tax=Ambrosia artemisiifolia TaxID=4212 RepID=A0AAD5CAC1_AMBAR|nr:hypothetical protein M8C21_011964 [Ambrosia artemisiifolia]
MRENSRVSTTLRSIPFWGKVLVEFRLLVGGQKNRYSDEIHHKFMDIESKCAIFEELFKANMEEFPMDCEEVALEFLNSVYISSGTMIRLIGLNRTLDNVFDVMPK